MINEHIEALVKTLHEHGVADEQQLLAHQRRHAKKHGSFVPKDQLTQAYQKLVAEGILVPNPLLARLLRLKATRSDSGIVVVSVLTKPYQCPGVCLYCPTQKGVPKSYLDTEPAVMRAVMAAYDPYVQTTRRLESLRATGHPTDKVNIRVIGGTFSFYPRHYQTWFIKEVFRACNEFGSDASKARTLEDVQAENEHADNRIVEISVETRQDYIDRDELRHLRLLGVTKVELGVQSIYEDVLRLNRRGHGCKDTVRATKLLKDAGFKVAYQMMPGLPGSTYERDLAMFETIFSHQDFQPDHLKIYPLALLKGTGVYGLYKRGQYRPYDVDELTRLLAEIKGKVPYYCRVERVIRDIPAHHIVEGGSRVSNLRQVIQEHMKRHGTRCACIRCREVRSDVQDEEVGLFRETYASSDGVELFLSMENPSRTRLYSLLRLRIPSTAKPIAAPLAGAALVREIHTYGSQLRLKEREAASGQHKGYGKALLLEAERIAYHDYGKKRIAAIAGVGVRGYFKSNGYSLSQTYMVKELGCDVPLGEDTDGKQGGNQRHPQENPVR